MRKLTDKKIRWIIRQLNNGVPVREVAAVMRVSPRRIYQLRKQYKQTNQMPQLRSAGRKPKPVIRETRQLILKAYHRYKLGPVTLEKVIEKEFGVHIPHNTIYKVMLDHSLVVENMSKRKQKKWVRFERDHSMSLWQGDWKKIDGRWLIAFMDDSSRMITCYGLFNSPTTKNTIKVLEKGFADYGAPDEILTDHGTQFVAAKNRENAKHKFKEFLDKNGVKHIVARISHPQTNGKIERFFGLVEQKAILFNSIDELVHWHNYIKPHMALDFDELETPDQAFYNRLPPERVLSTSGRWLIEE